MATAETNIVHTIMDTANLGVTLLKNVRGRFYTLGVYLKNSTKTVTGWVCGFDPS
jgi:hypothetical protein